MITIPATLNEDGVLRFESGIVIKTAQKVLVTFLEQAIEAISEDYSLSEPSLAKDWLRPEEDQAWKHLQKAPSS